MDSKIRSTEAVTFRNSVEMEEPSFIDNAKNLSGYAHDVLYSIDRAVEYCSTDYPKLIKGHIAATRRYVVGIAQLSKSIYLLATGKNAINQADESINYCQKVLHIRTKNLSVIASV